MHSKVSHEITYLFPNFNGCAVDVWEWISHFIPHFIIDIIKLGLKLNYVIYEATQIHLKTKFEKNPANPSMFSRANKVSNEINKLILKIIIKNSHIGIQF